MLICCRKGSAMINRFGYVFLFCGFLIIGVTQQLNCGKTWASMSHDERIKHVEEQRREERARRKKEEELKNSLQSIASEIKKEIQGKKRRNVLKDLETKKNALETDLTNLINPPAPEDI